MSLLQDRYDAGRLDLYAAFLSYGFAAPIPVLYLHHGGGENETGWIWQGKINYIADNLIARGMCEDMIIVMTCLYDMDYDHPDAFIAGDFVKFLVQDCIPLVEDRYRVIQDPASPRNLRTLYGVLSQRAGCLQSSGAVWLYRHALRLF